VILLQTVVPRGAVIAGPFDPLPFAVLSLAVILNRGKKLVPDSFAIRAGLTQIITLGYCVGTIAAVIFAAVALREASARSVSWAYLFGHFITFMVTLLALRREILSPRA
jgi:hypothetical protein